MHSFTIFIQHLPIDSYAIKSEVSSHIERKLFNNPFTDDIVTTTQKRCSSAHGHSEQGYRVLAECNTYKQNNHGIYKGACRYKHSVLMDH